MYICIYHVLRKEYVCIHANVYDQILPLDMTNVHTVLGCMHKYSPALCAGRRGWTPETYVTHTHTHTLSLSLSLSLLSLSLSLARARTHTHTLLQIGRLHQVLAVERKEWRGQVYMYMYRICRCICICISRCRCRCICICGHTYIYKCAKAYSSQI